MKIEIDIKEMEDKLLNPLNGILTMAYNTSEYVNISKEVEEMVKVLEVKGLITPRKRKRSSL